MFFPFFTKSHLEKNVTRENTRLFLLPDELIISIFEFLPLSDLLNLLSIVSIHLHRLLKVIILHRLHQSNEHHLRIQFKSESDESLSIAFVLSRLTHSHLIFTPCHKRIFKVILRKPIVQKAFLIGSNSDRNLISSAYVTDIREEGMKYTKYKDHLRFIYSIFPTPDNIINTKSGVKWIEPVQFECPFEFLYQPRKSSQMRVVGGTPPRNINPKLFNRSTSVHQLQSGHHRSSLNKLQKKNFWPLFGGLAVNSASILLDTNHGASI